MSLFDFLWIFYENLLEHHYCISDSSIVLNIFRNIHSINRFPETNQVEGSDQPHI